MINDQRGIVYSTRNNCGRILSELEFQMISKHRRYGRALMCKHSGEKRQQDMGVHYVYFVTVVYIFVSLFILHQFVVCICPVSAFSD